MEILIVRFSITFVLGFVLCFIITGVVRRIAVRFKVLDIPDKERKIHTRPTPLMGGVALYAAFLLTCAIMYYSGWLSDDRVPLRLLVGLAIAGGVLMISGILDDRFGVTWWQQMLGPVISIVIVLAAGLQIPFITNPFGTGVLSLHAIALGGYQVPLGSALVLLWLLGMMFTTKLLDGIDGLTTSVSFIGTLVIFVVSLFWDKSGSTTSYLCLALAGAALGFLLWNWHPAKIFLGEAGSTFFGFMLAVLSIISGGKIATALLVMGVPILDVVWIIMRRLLSRHKVFTGDDKHLHFRLLRAGLSQRQVVIFMALISLLFGSVSFFFTTKVKLIALVALLVFMFILASVLVHRYEKNSPNP